jgi:replicative DNA helicase
MEITADKTLDYLKIVIDRSKQRSFIKACNKAVSKAYDTFNENIISDLRVEMNKALN